MVTNDIMAFYPSIQHEVGLKSQRELLGKRQQKKIPTDELAEIGEFVLKNSFFNLMVKLSSRSQEQL